MWKKVLKYVVLVALVAYITVAVVWANRQAQSQHCTGLDIVIEQEDGAQQQFVSKEGVLADLGPLARDYAKYPVSRINISALEKRMMRNNSYERVECAFTPDGRLRIRILPMIPEARVVCPNGNGYYINCDGKRMDANPLFHINVPVIAGNFNNKFTAAQVLPVVRMVRSDKALNQLVSMIYARDANNIFLIPRIKGHVICLGDTTDLRTKVDNLMLMYSKVMPYKGWETYDTISVKFKGQIVATRRDKTPLHVPENVEETEDADEESLQQAYLADNDRGVTIGDSPTAPPKEEKKKEQTKKEEKKETKKEEKEKKKEEKKDIKKETKKEKSKKENKKDPPKKKKS